MIRLAHRKEVGHLRSRPQKILSALYMVPGADVHISAIMSRSKISMPCCDWLWTVTAWANHSRMEKSGPESSTWCTCWNQQSHENISHPFWSAHRESNWLVGRSETRNKTNSACIPWHNIPNHLSRALSRLSSARAM